ncbi:MAG: hypothetical protein ACLQU1_42875 [Bryobacteraceae bacterium]
MKPPRAAELLLLAIAGDAEAEFVGGDLAEDFGCIFAQRGRRAARRWYAWQVARSAPALMALRMRSGELTEIALRAVTGVLLPLVALDQLWRFVYSQIPLKDGVVRAPAMLAANVLLVALCSWMAGWNALKPRSRRAPRAPRAGLEAVAALAAVTLAVRVAVGAAPQAYILCLLLAAPANSLWRVWRRKLR